uniref:TGF_BETA_2 domain-containing protein n=1 Tax=Parastrongyloides trichosuri TaxID=131310 RepID=A0A0N4ZG70_PARTI
MEPADVGNFLPKDKLKHLVLLSGLDTVNVPFHKAVHSGFMSRSLASDSCPLTYKNFTSENIIETPKLIKNQNRILRYDWPLKYTQIYPAAIVLFYDLNWSTVNWEEKKKELETKIDALRNVIQKDGKPHNKGTQIILVIIQHNDGVTKEENDKLCSIKAAEILSTTKLKSNQLYVIPDTESTLYNFVLRLEKQFYELTPIFYQECIRKVRSRNIPNNNLVLLIRQQFKLGFLSEIRQDNHTAVRNYKLAYQKCSELEMNDRDIYEILSVASAINFKICQLSFQNNLIRESFAQYAKHQNTYFNRPCGKYPNCYLAMIEFNLWKRQQCSLFARLFENAVNNGLLALVHKNPGIYYQAAAEFQRAANISIKEMLTITPINGVVHQEMLIFDESLSKTHTIYFGQRPWRVLTDLMPNNFVDSNYENCAILGLQSSISPNYQYTIQLYNMAIKHFEKFHACRFQIRIKSQIADELISSGNYKQAQLFLYDNLMEFYRTRNYVLTQNLLVKFLEVAYFNANINDYMWAISQLSTPIQYTFSMVNILQHTNFYSHNLINLFQGNIPAPLKSGVISLNETETHAVLYKWQQSLLEKPAFKINLTGLVCFLQVSVNIMQMSSDFKQDECNTIIVKVNITNDLNYNMSFRNLTLYIEDCCKVPNIVTNDVLEKATLKLTKNDINIEKNSTQTYYFYFNPEILETNFLTNNIQIESLVLSEVTLPNTIVNGSFHWDFPINDSSSSIIFKKYKLPLSIDVLSKDTLYYFGEKFVLPLSICNVSKNMDLNMLECILTLSNHEYNHIDVKADKKIFLIDSNTKTRVSSYTHYIELLSMGNNLFLNVEFDTDKINEFYIHLNISQKDNNNSSFFKSYKINVVQAIKWNASISSLSNEILNQVTNNTHSMLQFDCEACTEMFITSISWNLHPSLVPTSQLYENYTPETYQHLESSAISSYLITFIASLEFGKEDSINIGKIAINWKRPSSDVINCTIIDLGTYAVIHIPITIQSQILSPNCLIIRKPIPVQYVFKNNYFKALTFKVTLDISEAFMFCGDKEQLLTLMPGEIFENCLTLFALTAGRLPYPKINLSFTDDSNPEFPKIYQDLALKSLPTRIFVMFFLLKKFFVDCCERCNDSMDLIEQERKDEVLKIIKQNIKFNDNLFDVNMNLKNLKHVNIGEKRLAEFTEELENLANQKKNNSIETYYTTEELLTVGSKTPLGYGNGLSTYFKFSNESKSKIPFSANLHVYLVKPEVVETEVLYLRLEIYRRYKDGTIGEEMGNIEFKHDFEYNSNKVVIPINSTWLNNNWSTKINDLAVYVKASIIHPIVIVNDFIVTHANSFIDTPVFEKRMIFSIKYKNIISRSKRSQLFNCTIKNGKSCCLKSLKINLIDIGWNFVLSPQHIDVGICLGDCQLLDNNSLNSDVINYRRDSFPNYKSCCHPTKYESLKMLISVSNTTISEINIPNLLTRQCGCY